MSVEHHVVMARNIGALLNGLTIGRRAAITSSNFTGGDDLYFHRMFRQRENLMLFFSNDRADNAAVYTQRRSVGCGGKRTDASGVSDLTHEFFHAVRACWAPGQNPLHRCRLCSNRRRRLRDWLEDVFGESF